MVDYESEEERALAGILFAVCVVFVGAVAVAAAVKLMRLLF
jgi:hypothetical protein